ncbi:MAG: XdhC family protein [Anaerolineales bacterium]
MRDILSDLDNWLANDEPIALATVIQTWGSAPRQAGAKMALTPDGKITGSVSGGCVEGAVFEAGTQTLASSVPQLLQFGVADETAWEVGLACGGNIQVFVQPLDKKFYADERGKLQSSVPHAVVTVVEGEAAQLGRTLIVADGAVSFGSLGASDLDEAAVAAAQVALAERRSQRTALAREGATLTDVFVEVVLPPPTLIMVGGVHIAVALTAIARALGYRTVVVDPRRSFGSAERFPHVDELIQAWPDEALAQVGLTETTAVAMLTHDPKLDDPALQAALPSPAFYVGALGSKTTQAKRRERLRAMGVAEAQLDRLHGPIGLDIGGRSPDEIALAIMAEVVTVRNQQQPTAG